MNKNKLTVIVILLITIGVITYTLVTKAGNSSSDKTPLNGQISADPEQPGSNSNTLTDTSISTEEKRSFQNKYMQVLDESLERLMSDDESRRAKIRESSKEEIFKGIALKHAANTSDEKFKIFQKYLSVNISWILDKGSRYNVDEETQDQLIVDLIKVFLRRRPLEPDNIKSFNQVRLSLRENAVGRLKEVFTEFIEKCGVEYFESVTEEIQSMSLPVDDYFLIESAMLYSSSMNVKIPSDWPKLDENRLMRAKGFLKESQEEEQKSSPNEAVVISKHNMYKAMMTLELKEHCRSLSLTGGLRPPAPDFDLISKDFFVDLNQDDIKKNLVLRSKLPSRL